MTGGRTRFWCRAAIWAGVALAGVAGQKPAAGTGPADAPPQLITTDGGGPKWKNLGELRQFAAKGDPQACFDLGVRLMEGGDLPADLPRARTLFEQAAKGGVADAWFRLGKIHCEGLGVLRDYAEGFSCFAEAATRGVPEAQHNVGAMLVSARGVKRDYVEGLAWIILAGKAGAVSDAETQVRARLANRPADIAAAEARASELWENLKQSKPIAPRVTVVGPASKPAEAPLFQPEKTAPPKVELSAPKVDLLVPPPPPAAPASKP